MGQKLSKHWIGASPEDNKFSVALNLFQLTDFLIKELIQLTPLKLFKDVPITLDVRFISSFNGDIKKVYLIWENIRY